MSNSSIYKLFATMVAVMFALSLSACDSGDGDESLNLTDTSVDTNSNADADSDTNSDTGSETDNDTGSDTDSDNDTETDTNTDMNLGITHAFTSGTENFNISYSEPEGLAAASTLSYDAVEGFPEAGALKLEIPFSALGDKVSVSIIPAAPIDMTEVTVTAMINLASGLTTNESALGGVKLFLKSGSDFLWADGGWNNIKAGTGWISISIYASNPAGFIAAPSFDPSDIREIGIEVGTNAIDAGDYTDAVIYIDTVKY